MTSVDLARPGLIPPEPTNSSWFTSMAYWIFALERGDWDATWYCIDCYMRYYIRSIARAAKKALYAHGDNQNAIRDNESTLFDVSCSDLARFV